MDEDRFASAALHTFTLVATLRAALDVRQGIAGRRAGRDPSADEPAAPVRAYLQDALGRLAALLVRLRLRAAAPAAPGAHAALVQSFEDCFALTALAEELRVAHQKLLSLYPAVDAALVEGVRQRHGEALRLVEEGAFDDALPAFCERLADDLDRLRQALV